MSELNINSQLKELGGSDYKIVKGQPDIKGWKVKDARAQTLGEVRELIFDHESQKVRYIVLAIDGDGMELEQRLVLIPIGLAEIDEQDDHVILPNISTVQLHELPIYQRDAISTETESRIREIFSGSGLGSSANAGTTYTHSDDYNPDNLFKRRIKVAGNTVIGIFDNGFEAQNTVTKLKMSGFNDEQIDICVRIPSQRDEDHSKVSKFFNTLLENKEQASHFTEVAKKGTIITVHANSDEDARHAAEILDQHGSLNMERQESTEKERSGTLGEKDLATVRARLHSTIIGRSVSNNMRLRSGAQPGTDTPDPETGSEHL